MLKLLFNHFTHSQILSFAYRNFCSLVCVFRQDQAVFQQKRSFKICSHVLFELQLGSFLSTTCHGLQHISFCSCCFTIHIWSWLWATPVLCPHLLLVGSAGKWGPPPCHAWFVVMQGIREGAMLHYIVLCYALLCSVMFRYVASRTLQPSVQSYSQELYDAMRDRQLVCPNIWWILDSLLWLVTV